MKILISKGTGDPVNYLEAVAAAGGEATAAYLPRGGEGYAGLILAGGVDMEPSLFGQENRGTEQIDTRRDDEPDKLQLSNFGLYQDRETGDFRVTLSKLGQFGQEQVFKSDCMVYLISID